MSSPGLGRDRIAERDIDQRRDFGAAKSGGHGDLHALVARALPDGLDGDCFSIEDKAVFRRIDLNDACEFFREGVRRVGRRRGSA